MSNPLKIVGREIFLREDPVAIIFNAQTINASIRAEFETLIESAAVIDVDTRVAEAEENLHKDFHDCLREILCRMNVEIKSTLFEDYPCGIDTLIMGEAAADLLKDKFEMLAQKIATLEAQVDERI